LGSGTVKWSVFERGPDGWRAKVLEEVNTELRKGMGPELTLKSGPVQATLKACGDFLGRSRSLGLQRLPAYGTSALRKARNREALLGPLRELGVECRILDAEDEGRLNLLGLLAGAASPPMHGVQAGPPLVVDPGGDSTEICADLDGKGWAAAAVASLPFGSVSLQERFGSDEDNQALPWSLLQEIAGACAAELAAFGPARPFLGRTLLPAIRMNQPIQRALETVNQRPFALHGQGGLYSRAELEALARETAGLEHAGRAELLSGEPLGKIDRTSYGFASWLGLLQGLQAEHFTVEPWGIKLGAALSLNHAHTGLHG
jgi:exopolyphosphatase / guanosine-5'-triphosphate,3'-diphosphate pyrophosphatase